MGKILTTVDEIQGRLGMTQEEAAKLSAIVETYPMAVPEYYLSLIDENDPNDPIRRMCIPSEDEMDGDGVYDTSGESDNTVAVGLQHKYPQTVLILSTNHCAMYCRHCFRKRMVGATEEEINNNFLATVDYIKAHPEVNNVLITGGDALLLSHEMMARYLEAFTGMDQLQFVRIGSRLPVVFPEKLTSDEKLQEILASAVKKKQLYLITQFNQTVLLKGVNDDPQVLGMLLRKLTAIGVLPYYVFQCRPVRGVKNRFQVPLVQGARIVDEAKRMQNGQGKAFRYCMSTPKGKLEILGQLDDGRMLFKFHQAKDAENHGRIFARTLEAGECWIEP